MAVPRQVQRSYPHRARAAAVALTLALVLLYPGDARAYIDVGAGSMLLQVAVASLLGMLYTLKRYWRVWIARFRGKPSAVHSPASGAPPKDESA
jgi:hypothetical protein